MHKQVFSLVTGSCLDDQAVTVPAYRVRVRDGWVEVGPVTGSPDEERRYT